MFDLKEILDFAEFIQSHGGLMAAVVALIMHVRHMHEKVITEVELHEVKFHNRERRQNVKE